MDNNVYKVAGGLGVLLVSAGFFLGVLFQVGIAWLLLLVGAFLLTYAIYCRNRPFLREWTD